MKKTLKIPSVLYREGVIAGNLKRDDGGDGDEMELSISSCEPYLRYDWMADEDYFEVLSHDDTGMDSTRLRAGTALLFNHNRDIQLGTISAPQMRDGKCYVKATLSNSDDVKGYRQRVAEGVLKDTSVGYRITDDGECIGAKDGIPIYKFKWAPYEASLVTIPADITVGVGRQRDTKTRDGKEIDFREITVDDGTNKEDKQTTRQNLSMKLTPAAQRHFNEADKDKGGNGEGGEQKKEIDIEVIRAEGRKAYMAACKKIRDHAGAIKNAEWKAAAITVAEKHCAMDNPDFEAFRSEANDVCPGVTALTKEQANPRVGIDMASIRRFSFCKAMLELHSGKGLTGVEKEVCDFSAKAYEDKDGREFKGVCIPADITDARVDETMDLDKRGLENLQWQMRRLESKLQRAMNASTFASGGFLVGTELLAASFIEYLRNACFIGQGPFAIIELGGLVGNVAIPKQTTTATTYWLPEGGAVTASEFAGSQLYGTPHRLACLSQWTKQLMLQSTPAVEMLVRNDQARAVAVEEDRVAYQGSGASGEPIGIFNTTGIDASVTFSGNWTQAKSLAFQLAIENANANTVGEMVYVTNPTTKSYAMGTVQVASSTFPIYIWMDSNGQYPTISGSIGGKVLSYGAYSTKNMTSRVLFGIYNNNFTKFRWGGMDLMVEPYTGAGTETIKSYLNEWMDQGIRYPQAFSLSTDSPTSP